MMISRVSSSQNWSLLELVNNILIDSFTFSILYKFVKFLNDFQLFFFNLLPQRLKSLKFGTILHMIFQNFQLKLILTNSTHFHSLLNFFLLTFNFLLNQILNRSQIYIFLQLNKSILRQKLLNRII